MTKYIINSPPVRSVAIGGETLIVTPNIIVRGIYELNGSINIVIQENFDFDVLKDNTNDIWLFPSSEREKWQVEIANISMRKKIPKKSMIAPRFEPSLK